LVNGAQVRSPPFSGERQARGEGGRLSNDVNDAGESRSRMKETTYRGITITDERAKAEMQRFDKERRASFPGRKWKTYAIEFNGQKYPPKEILRMMTGVGIAGGGAPINSRFEQLGFNIVELTEPPAGLVVGVDEEAEEAIETALSLEQDLERSILQNLGRLEKGLKLYEKNGVTGQQLDAKPAGRIDILADDTGGDLVVIELKAGEADRQVCGQIQAYMGWVKANLAGKRKVRGIIVANEFTDRLKLAVNVVPGLTLKKYAIVFSFSDPS
jgi:hypothetical protein